VSRPSDRQARLATVTLDDQITAIAGVLVHGERFGTKPGHLPNEAARAVFELVALHRSADGRDLLAVAKLVREAIAEKRIEGGDSLLADAIAFSDLEAPMRPHELERNAKHLARAAEYARLVHERDLAHERGEHELLAELAGKLAALESGEKRDGELVVVKASGLEEKPVEWLWPGYLPAGVLTLFSSLPKCGKSTLTMSIAARITTGALWPCGPGLPSQARAHAPIGDVLVIAYEDDLERTVVPRLTAAGADMDRVHFLRGIRRKRGKRDTTFAIDLGEHFDQIEALVRELNPRLVIIDPVMSGFGGDRDTNADNEVRAVLGPFVALAEETRAGILLVTHTNKRGEGSAMDSVIGSRAFTGICRMLLGLAKFNDGTGKRVFARIDGTLGAPRPGLVFEIKSRDGNEARSHIEYLEEFDGEMDDFRADQKRREQAAKQAGAETRQAACNAAMLEIVRAELWIESTVLDAMLGGQGHNKRAIERAQTALIGEHKLDNRKCGGIWWTGLAGTTPNSPRFTRARGAGEAPKPE
jgi:putative DNA primase/helicase